MKIIFVRHGQTDANASSKSGGSQTELNQKGIEQAKEVALELKGVDIDAIISSPLKRAYQTAEIINEYHNKPIAVDDRLRELQTGAYVDMETWNRLFDFDTTETLKGGESLHDFFDRVHACITELAIAYVDKTVLVVSHGGVHHAVYALVNELPRTGNMRLASMRNCEYKVYEIVSPSVRMT